MEVRGRRVEGGGGEVEKREIGVAATNNSKIRGNAETGVTKPAVTVTARTKTNNNRPTKTANLIASGQIRKRTKPTKTVETLVIISRKKSTICFI